MRYWYRLLSIGAGLLVAAAGRAAAEEPRVLMSFVQSSFDLPTRVVCLDMVPDHKALRPLGAPTFSVSTNAYCPNLVRGTARARQSARLGSTPTFRDVREIAPEAVVSLVLEGSAVATNSRAYAGLYKLELGGASGRWRLSNITRRTGLALIGCQLDFQTSGASKMAVAGMGDVMAEGSARLLDPFTGAVLADLCPLPTDVPEGAYGAPAGSFKLARATKVCFGASSSIDLQIEGRALAKAEAGAFSESSTSAVATVMARLTNVQASAGAGGETLYAECDAAPGHVVVLGPAKP